MGEHAQDSSPQAPVFISYRRADKDKFAEPFFEQLTDWFGDQAVFLDRKDIKLGTPFPSYLDDAVRAASVVLVVITPIWLDELNQRSGGNEMDYVRREVALALELKRLLIPVFWATAPMAKDALPPELQPLLDCNAVQLAGPKAQWGEPFRLLRRRISEVTGLKPVPTTPEFRAWEAVRGKIGQILTQPVLQALAESWGADPLGAFDPDRRGELIANLVMALQSAKEIWSREQPSPDQQRRRTEDCLKILSLLCELMVDRAAAREWSNTAGHDHPVPVDLAGTAALVHSVANNCPVELSPDCDDSKGFFPERMVDLLGSAGVGRDRQAHAHREVWARAKKTTPYPASQAPLSGKALDDFRKFLAFSAKVRKPFMLTDTVGHETHVMREFTKLGAELGIPAIGRLGSEADTQSPVLHQDEVELKIAINWCLDLIKTIGSPS